MRQTASSIPASSNARCHARTCWYTLSISVPSRSNRNAALQSPLMFGSPIPPGERAQSGRRSLCLVFVEGARRILLFLVALARGHAVVAGEPAAEIDEGTAMRAEGPVPRHRRLAADRARAGRDFLVLLFVAHRAYR